MTVFIHAFAFWAETAGGTEAVPSIGSFLYRSIIPSENPFLLSGPLLYDTSYLKYNDSRAGRDGTSLAFVKDVRRSQQAAAKVSHLLRASFLFTAPSVRSRCPDQVTPAYRELSAA